MLEDVLVALEHHTNMDMITPSGEVIGVMDFTIKQLALYEIPFVELLPLVKPKTWETIEEPLFYWTLSNPIKPLEAK